MKQILLGMSLVLLISCASPLQEVVQKTVPVAVDTTLQQATTPDNKGKVASLLEGATVQTVLQGVDQSTVDIVLSRLNDPENEKNVVELLRKLTGALATQQATTLPPEIKRKKDEAVAHTARLSTRAALDEVRKELPSIIRDIATNPAVREALTPLSRAAATGAVKGAADTLTGGN